jgi:hypothetical protein
MKKLVFWLFAFTIAVSMAWAQEPLVPKPDFGAVPRSGQSEIVINNTSRHSILVSINGTRAAHLMPGEVAKVIVNNGSISVEAQRLVYTNKQGWVNPGAGAKAASLVLNPNSQSIQLNVDASGISGNASIRQTGTKSLQTQSSSTPAQNTFSASGIETAVKYGVEMLLESIPARATVAVISVASRDRQLSECVIGEVEYIVVNNSGCRIVDRRRLETVMQEQNFQMSGNVDDNSAVSIGKLLGANIVITGSDSGSGTTRRLRLTAINVQTGEIVAMASERF